MMSRGISEEHISDSILKVCSFANVCVRSDPHFDPTKEVGDTINLLMSSAYTLAVASGSTPIQAVNELRRCLNHVALHYENES